MEEEQQSKKRGGGAFRSTESPPLCNHIPNAATFKCHVHCTCSLVSPQ